MTCVTIQARMLGPTRGGSGSCGGRRRRAPAQNPQIEGRVPLAGAEVDARAEVAIVGGAVPGVLPHDALASWLRQACLLAVHDEPVTSEEGVPFDHAGPMTRVTVHAVMRRPSVRAVALDRHVVHGRQPHVEDRVRRAFLDLDVLAEPTVVAPLVDAVLHHDGVAGGVGEALLLALLHQLVPCHGVRPNDSLCPLAFEAVRGRVLPPTPRPRRRAAARGGRACCDPVQEPKVVGLAGLALRQVDISAQEAVVQPAVLLHSPDNAFAPRLAQASILAFEERVVAEKRVDVIDSFAAEAGLAVRAVVRGPGVGHVASC
mmetsp:Transcript_17076/g.45616  ORF Transcript_17076/g.45616 Transcript_17076/m.45616 type:complete len:316 (-) Transcript_17076:1423-2370(-)